MKHLYRFKKGKILCGNGNFCNSLKKVYLPNFFSLFFLNLLCVEHFVCQGVWME